MDAGNFNLFQPEKICSSLASWYRTHVEKKGPLPSLLSALTHRHLTNQRKGHTSLYCCGSQCRVLRPVASALLGNLLEMQILMSHLRATELNTQAEGPESPAHNCTAKISEPLPIPSSTLSETSEAATLRN